jgi:hypothetical protein
MERQLEVEAGVRSRPSRRPTARSSPACCRRGGTRPSPTSATPTGWWR